MCWLISNKKLHCTHKYLFKNKNQNCFKVSVCAQIKRSRTSRALNVSHVWYREPSCLVLWHLFEFECYNMYVEVMHARVSANCLPFPKCNMCFIHSAVSLTSIWLHMVEIICIFLCPSLPPCVQVALCIWGWCSEPFFGAAYQTRWAVNSACWYPCLSMASSPSSPPLSKATVCSSCAAWCLALGEFTLLLNIFPLYTLSSLMCLRNWSLSEGLSLSRPDLSSHQFLCCLPSSKVKAHDKRLF